MKSFLMRLFAENSDVSSLRVMSVLCCVFACLIAGYGIYNRIDMGGLAELCGVFLGAAFTGKVAQKHLELRGKEDA